MTNVGSQSSPTFADIDRDGDLDAFIGHHVSGSLFFRNTGTASAPAFAAPVANPFRLTYLGGPTSPEFADIDGDGDLDAFIMSSGSYTTFFENTGGASAPAFASGFLNPFGLTGSFAFGSPEFADIEGDGDLDAFIGERDGNTYFFENTGGACAPAFAAPVANPFGLTSVTYSYNGYTYGGDSSPAFADIEGDGDLDAFIGETFGSTIFFQNTGGASTPAFAAAETSPFGLTRVANSSSPAFGDIDGDGDLDAVIGQTDGVTFLFENVGSTAVPPSTPPVVCPTRTPTPAPATPTHTPTPRLTRFDP